MQRPSAPIAIAVTLPLLLVVVVAGDRDLGPAAGPDAPSPRRGRWPSRPSTRPPPPSPSCTTLLAGLDGDLPAGTADAPPPRARPAHARRGARVGGRSRAPRAAVRAAAARRADADVRAPRGQRGALADAHRRRARHLDRGRPARLRRAHRACRRRQRPSAGGVGRGAHHVARAARSAVAVTRSHSETNLRAVGRGIYISGAWSAYPVRARTTSRRSTTSRTEVRRSPPGCWRPSWGSRRHRSPP